MYPFRTSYMDGEDKGRAERLAKGRVEGKAEGEKRKTMKIAKTMNAKGMDVNTISEITKLAPAEIKTSLEEG